MHRAIAFFFICAGLLGPALLLPRPAVAAEGGPGSTEALPSIQGQVAKPAPLPALRGPVRIPRDLVLQALRENDEEVIVRDDRPSDPAYQPVDVAPAARGAAPASAAEFGANIRVNTLDGTPANNGECEVSLAAVGSRLVSGWNDGQFWELQPGFVGYGYSTDGGTTWTDGGSLPTVGVTDVYYGDPVLVADPTGHWYFADLYRPSAGVTGISVNHGTFAGAAPVWDPPVAIATSPTDYLDKPWLGVDPATGAVYVAYIRFFSGGQQLEFSRSLDHGASWSVPVVLTNPSVSAPMSPRFQVGPSGELYLAYYLYDYNDGREYLRVRRSLDQGASFGAESSIGGRPFANNYFSGPAGYNRERVVALVSIDVDRSIGPRRGALYAVWQEGVDYAGDDLGSGGNQAEVEPNNNSASATSFTLGQALQGSLSSTADQDWWSFSGTAGQTVEFYLTPNASSCDGFLRMFAGGGATTNRCAYSHYSIIFTLPSTGTYYLRVLNWSGNASDIGAYTVYTGTHTPVAQDLARDHRDVILSSSGDGGATWTTPVVVSDAPARFDETWPEVAVDPVGRVHVIWYDHHEDAANGILTAMYYTRSDDGGVTFQPSARFSTGSAVNWSNVATNLFPNMGDYCALVASGMDVYANWSDGRDGTPDSYFARLVEVVAVEPGLVPQPRQLAVRGLRPLQAGRARVLLSLPVAGAATVDLFDVVGRRVAEESLREPGAGDHVLDLGEDLGPGMYFVRLRQNEVQAMAKVASLR